MITTQTNLPFVRRALAKMPEQIESSAMFVLGITVQEIQRIMQRPAVKPSYPIKWDSPRQRAHVIAKLRKQGNLPYKRTNAYVDGWKVSHVQDGYILSNEDYKAPYVTGDPATGEYQSKIEAGRWPKIQAVVERLVAELPEALLKRLNIEVGPEQVDLGNE